MDLAEDHSYFKETGSHSSLNKIPKECSQVLPPVWCIEKSNLDERLGGICQVSVLESDFGKLEDWQK